MFELIAELIRIAQGLLTLKHKLPWSWMLCASCLLLTL